MDPLVIAVGVISALLSTIIGALSWWSKHLHNRTKENAISIQSHKDDCTKIALNNVKELAAVKQSFMREIGGVQKDIALVKSDVKGIIVAQRKTEDKLDEIHIIVIDLAASGKGEK